MKKTSHTTNCFGTEIVATNLKSAIHTVCRHLSQWKGQYITFVNVHALMTAREDAKYMEAQKGAVCNFSDGRPIVWLQKKKGYVEASRVAGPDFMEGILEISQEKGYRHFFYGSDSQTLEKMRDHLLQKYPDLQIAGIYAPAFAEQLDEDIFEEFYSGDIEKINDTHPDFVWVSLGAPKQEMWMQYGQNKVTGLMLGVGAAFDFFAGVQKRAPKWMQKTGLEWLFRLMQDPKRLGKRYFYSNSKFLVECGKEILHLNSK